MISRRQSLGSHTMCESVSVPASETHRTSGAHERLLHLSSPAQRRLTMTDSNASGCVVPPQLLHAVAQRDGRIALVVGAGCSLEAPTNLKLATVYAEDVYRRLVLDRVLSDGDCGSPDDLSAIASTVWTKHGRQSEVVERLPRVEFRLARPNDGYLAAAALLRERAVSAVLTLNFDLAMTTALVEVGAREVNVVPGPAAAADLGSLSLIYLHRNVDESDPEQWILRVEALAEAWQGQWEEVVSQRVMSTPVVVFAGLGSPAAVLTESVAKVRQAVTAQHQAFVVDPAESTAFEAALDLPPESHVRVGWCAFMEALARRVAEELSAKLMESCQALSTAHGWADDPAQIEELCQRLYSNGLVKAGKLKASWLLSDEPYVVDDERRVLIADLLLAIGVLERTAGASGLFQPSGVVEFTRAGAAPVPVLVVSGGGALRWAALEPLVHRALTSAPNGQAAFALVGGVQGTRPSDLAPPSDIIHGDVDADIIEGYVGIEYVTVDDVRSDPAAVAASLVA